LYRPEIGKEGPCPVTTTDPKQELATAMPHTMTRFRTRRDAEKALAEIIEDGGTPADYRIDAHPLGGFVISVFDDNGEGLAGVIGA
jgi:hypothetical protein